jgi:phage tail-like protein
MKGKKKAGTDRYRKFKFRVEIDGIIQAGFNECSCGDSTTKLSEYREGTELPNNIKFSGQTKYGNITLKWGITDSLDLYNWHKQFVVSGTAGARKNISIILIDEAENEKSRWNIVDAWPSKYDLADLNIKGNDVAIETLEIVHEGLKKVL